MYLHLYNYLYFFIEEFRSAGLFLQHCGLKLFIKLKTVKHNRGTAAK